MRKPVRKVRRFVRKRIKGKGKGTGVRSRLSGPGIYYLTSQLSDEQYEEMYFGVRAEGKGKGHSKGKRSTGKAAGRKTNPRGRDGEIMKCYGCRSIHHLGRGCPVNPSGPTGKRKRRGSNSSLPPNTVVYVDIVEQLRMCEPITIITLLL